MGSKVRFYNFMDGVNLSTTKTAFGSLTATVAAPDHDLLNLPALTSWKAIDSLLERLPDYNDSGIAWVGEFITFN